MCNHELTVAAQQLTLDTCSSWATPHCSSSSLPMALGWQNGRDLRSGRQAKIISTDAEGPRISFDSSSFWYLEDDGERWSQP